MSGVGEAKQGPYQSARGPIMLDPHLLLAFTAATALLMLIPGPNFALIVANSLAHGPRYGLLTVAGTVTGVLPQLLLVSLGLTGVTDLLGHGFEWLRWAGAAYLVLLGIRQWREPRGRSGQGGGAAACGPRHFHACGSDLDQQPEDAAVPGRVPAAIRVAGGADGAADGGAVGDLCHGGDIARLALGAARGAVGASGCARKAGCAPG